MYQIVNLKNNRALKVKFNSYHAAYGHVRKLIRKMTDARANGQPINGFGDFGIDAFGYGVRKVN